MILWFLGLFIEENQLTISLHDLHLAIIDNTNVQLQQNSLINTLTTLVLQVFILNFIFFIGFRGKMFHIRTVKIWFISPLKNDQNSTVQKQPPKGVLKKKCPENMQQIYRRTPMPKFDFNKVALQRTLQRTLKSQFGMIVLLQICCIFSGYLFLGTPLGGYFWLLMNKAICNLTLHQHCFEEIFQIPFPYRYKKAVIRLSWIVNLEI